MCFCSRRRLISAKDCYIENHLDQVDSTYAGKDLTNLRSRAKKFAMLTFATGRQPSHKLSTTLESVFLSVCFWEFLAEAVCYI